MTSILLPGIEGGPQRDVPLRRHTLHIGPHTFDVLDLVESTTTGHVESELQTPSLLHTLGEGFDGVIVDVGANIGIYSILAAKMYPAARIVSVEPVADTFALLQRNVQLNAVRTDALQLAIRDVEQQMVMSWDTRNHGSASVLHPGLEMEIVQARRLPDVLDDNGVAVVDLLKLDIEGLEYAVLYAFSDADWKRVRRLSVELHGVMSFPHAVNRAIYQTMSEHLARMSARFGATIEVRWPHDHKPDVALLRAWRSDSFSLLFEQPIVRNNR